MGIMIAGETEVKKARLLALRQALKLEIQGIKVVRGTTAYAIIKKEFGWSGSRETILNKMNEVRELILEGKYNEQ